MNFHKITIFMILILNILLTSCGARKENDTAALVRGVEERQKSREPSEDEKASGRKLSFGSEEDRKDSGEGLGEEDREKGYDLPIRKQDRTRSEKECREAMLLVRDIYQKTAPKDREKEVISVDTAEQMMAALSGLGCPVSADSFYLDLRHDEKMLAFLQRAESGEKSNIVLYEIHSGGGIGRQEFDFDGEDMYVLYTNSTWTEQGDPMITITTYNRLKEWNYTETGWLCCKYSVPEPPEVTERYTEYDLLRVRPRKKEYREIALTYLLPLGYQGNNLLRSEWEAGHMEEIDFNGLFEALYHIQYHKSFDYRRYSKGIPGEEFEKLTTQFLPVSVKDLRRLAGLERKKGVYPWAELGCGNYAPDAIGTSAPEINKMKENKDGTVTIMVDAVCEMLGSPSLFTHELTVRFLENGGIQYLKNHIVRPGADELPEYQRRIKK